MLGKRSWISEIGWAYHGLSAKIQTHPFDWEEQHFLRWWSTKPAGGLWAAPDVVPGTPNMERDWFCRFSLKPIPWNMGLGISGNCGTVPRIQNHHSTPNLQWTIWCVEPESSQGKRTNLSSLQFLFAGCTLGIGAAIYLRHICYKKGCLKIDGLVVQSNHFFRFGGPKHHFTIYIFWTTI